MDEVLSEMSSKKMKKEKTDRKLYPVDVIDVEKIGKRVKINYEN